MLRSAAAEALEHRQIACVGLLQRRFKLGHASVQELMALLEDDGIVSAPRRDGRRLLLSAPDLSIFAEQVFETALYFREMLDQENVGDTRAIRLLSPYHISAVKVRAFTFGLYRHDGLSLEEAAIRLALWNPDGTAGKYSTEMLRVQIGLLFQEYEADVKNQPWPTDLVDRAFYRLARYLHREWAQSVPGNSRVFEFFLPADSVPRGLSHRGKGHAEHVVPCQFLRKHCIDMFNAGTAVRDVARVCRENLAIVDIHPEERNSLDRSRSHGGLGLKVTMPPGWRFGEGCIFERLHEADITFELPASALNLYRNDKALPCVSAPTPQPSLRRKPVTARARS